MRLFLLTLVAALVFAGTALAGPKQQLHRQQARYYHAVGYLTVIRHLSYRTLLSISPIERLKWSAKVNKLIYNRDDARQRIARLKQEIRLSARPPHYALWLCIHGGEGAWNDNTGNGYYGGMQMHEWWGGVQYAYLLSPMQQMWLAEREYRTHGYSYSWLYGQWAADAGCF